MLKLFISTDKTFGSNGDVVLRPLKAKVHKEVNSDYYLDITVGLEYAEWIAEGNIIVANTPQGDQAFRIDNVTKSNVKISARCWHVFYDAENYLILDSYVQDKNCNDALNHLNNATEPASIFTMSSDIIKKDSFRCVRMSLYDAIETVLDRWGGYLIRDNFNIRIQQSIGVDNGVTVEYKKNLQELTSAEDWKDVVTKLLPTGYDGIMLNSLNPSLSPYLVSQTQYDIPYTKTVAFDQDIDEDAYPNETAYKQALIDDLRNQATAYLNSNCVPKVNYTLKANLEKITDVGDIVEVKDRRIGVDITTSVISFEYDCILKKYTEIEFGNFRQTLFGLVGNITSGVEKAVSNQLVNVNTEISNAITNVEQNVENNYLSLSGGSLTGQLNGDVANFVSFNGLVNLPIDTSASSGEDKEITDSLTKLGWMSVVSNALMSVKSVLNKVLRQQHVLLWTNASPTTAFAPQTVPLNLSDYDAVEIWAKTRIVDSNEVATLVSKAGTQGTYIIVPNIAEDTVANKYNTVRKVTVSGTGVKFGEGGYYRWSTTDSNLNLNDYCIPTKIYGVRR